MDKENKQIMECSLDNAGADVVTTLAGYIAKNLSKKSEAKFKGDNETNLLHNKYFKRLSRGGLTILSTSLADFLVISLLF